MNIKNNDIDFDGSFFDSDLDDDYDDDQDDDYMSDDVHVKQQKKIKKKIYPTNKIIMNVSGIFILFFSGKKILDTQYAVVKYVGKVIMKWVLQYELD